MALTAGLGPCGRSDRASWHPACPNDAVVRIIARWSDRPPRAAAACRRPPGRFMCASCAAPTCAGRSREVEDLLPGQRIGRSPARPASHPTSDTAAGVARVWAFAHPRSHAGTAGVETARRGAAVATAGSDMCAAPPDLLAIPRAEVEDLLPGQRIDDPPAPPPAAGHRRRHAAAPPRHVRQPAGARGHRGARTTMSTSAWRASTAPRIACCASATRAPPLRLPAVASARQIHPLLAGLGPRAVVRRLRRRLPVLRSRGRAAR